MKEDPRNIANIHAHCADEKLAKFQAANKGLKLQLGEFAKVGISDPGKPGKEYMWFEVTEILGRDRYLGRCDNDPVIVTSVIYNQTIIFDFKNVMEKI